MRATDDAAAHLVLGGSSGRGASELGRQRDVERLRELARHQGRRGPGAELRCRHHAAARYGARFIYGNKLGCNLSMANVKEAITRVVTQPTPQAFENFAKGIKQANDGTCRAVITHIKKILKDRSTPPTVKLSVLKVCATQLFHECMCVSNFHFLVFAQKKILKRLGDFARHRKAEKDPNRGVSLFGNVAGENQAAAAEFLRSLLNYIKTWAARYGQAPNGGDSDYLKLYRALQNENVTFPPDAAQPASPHQQPAAAVNARFKSDIDRCKQMADLLKQMLATNPNQSDVALTASQVEAYKATLEVEIQQCSNRQSSETEMNLLLDAHDYVSKILETYERVTHNQQPDPQADSLQATLRKTQVNIDQVEKELSEIRDRMYYRRASEEQKSPEEIRRDFEVQMREKEEKHRAKLAELDRGGDQTLEQQLAETQRQVELVQAQLRQKTMEIERDNKAYAALAAENRELASRLEEASKHQSPPSSPVPSSFYDSVRPSLNSLSPASGVDIFQTMPSMESSRAAPAMSVSADSLPIRNEKEYRALCSQDKGLLFEDALIQMGAQLMMSGTTGKCSVFVGNTGADDLESVSVQVIPVEGVQVQMEPKAPANISRGQKSVFNFSINVLQPFTGSARMLAMYVHQGSPVYVHLRLPVVVARALNPTQSDGATALRTWQSLAASEDLIRFSSMQPGINSMNSLAAVMRFKSNMQLFGAKDIPQLEKGAVLGVGQFQDRVVAALVTVEGSAKNGRIAVRSQDTRLRDALLSLLKDFVVG